MLLLVSIPRLNVSMESPLSHRQDRYLPLLDFRKKKSMMIHLNCRIRTEPESSMRQRALHAGCSVRGENACVKILLLYHQLTVGVDIAPPIIFLTGAKPSEKDLAFSYCGWMTNSPLASANPHCEPTFTAA